MVARIPEFTSADEEIAALQTRIATLETAGNEQVQSIDSVKAVAPVSEESIQVNFKEIQSKLAEIETQGQAAGLTQKLDVKVRLPQAAEIACKELVIKEIQDSAVRIQKARSEYEFLLTDLNVHLTSEAGAMQTHITDLRNKSQQDQDVLMTAADEMMVLGDGKTGRNWLLEELNTLVDTSTQELQGLLEFRLKQLDLSFKQECLGLRGQFEALKTRAVHLHPAHGEIDDGERARLYSEAKIALAKVEKYSDTNSANLRDVVQSITENLLLISSNLQSFLQIYHKTRPAEQADFAATRKANFEEKLAGAKFQIDMLRKNVEAIETSTNSELFKIEECGKLVALGGAKYSDLMPRVLKIKTRLPQNTLGLKSDIESLNQRLGGVWTQANQEGHLNIPQPSAVSHTQKDGMDALISLLETPESSKPFKQSNLS